MTCSAQDFEIKRGATFPSVVRWETAPTIFKAITGITATAPPVITAVGHGLVTGWRVAISDVVGMRQINAKGKPVPRASDYKQVTVLTANTFSIDNVSAVGYDAYTSGGVVQYNTPVDLAGFTARMTIKNRVGGTEIISLTTTNGRIIIDNTAKTISLLISATDTAALTATHGVYDLEMVSGAVPAVVTRILEGKVTFSDEVTT